MIKTLKFSLVILSIFLLSFIKTDAAGDDNPTVVYFGSSSCLVCIRIKEEGYLDSLRSQGVTVIEYALSNSPENIELLGAYNYEYRHLESAVGPIIFSGGEYYFDYDDIVDGYNSGEILSNSYDPLLEVDVVEYRELQDMSLVRAFIIALTGGFIDGFNPCAVAMLLLFISMLGFTKNKKLLIAVSITYIFALYISYFALGLFVVNSIQYFNANVILLSNILSWAIIILGFSLFIFNMYDYYMSKNEKFGNVKNQLPKYIQKFNKKIIRKFTNIINSTEQSIFGFISLLAITFGLGVIISLTEFLCTGQVYLPVIIQLSLQPNFTSLNITLLLMLYNFMFVLPLIVISVISIKSKSIMSVSNFIREKMYLIKLITAFFFLFLALYYIYDMFIKVV